MSSWDLPLPSEMCRGSGEIRRTLLPNPNMHVLQLVSTCCPCLSFPNYMLDFCWDCGLFDCGADAGCGSPWDPLGGWILGLHLHPIGAWGNHNSITGLQPWNWAAVLWSINAQQITSPLSASVVKWGWTFLSVSRFFFLLSYNLYSVKDTNLKCTTLWISIYV